MGPSNRSLVLLDEFLQFWFDISYAVFLNDFQEIFPFSFESFFYSLFGLVVPFVPVRLAFVFDDFLDLLWGNIIFVFALSFGEVIKYL